VAAAVIDIDQPAQPGRAVGVQRKAFVPQAQDGKDSLAQLHAQAGFARTLALAGHLQPLAHFF
jgi:hypothetical protein